MQIRTEDQQVTMTKKWGVAHLILFFTKSATCHFSLFMLDGLTFSFLPDRKKPPQKNRVSIFFHLGLIITLFKH